MLLRPYSKNKFDDLWHFFSDLSHAYLNPSNCSMKMVIVLLPLLVPILTASLSTVDLTSIPASSNYYVSSNPVGITFDFVDFSPNVNSDLLQRLLLNSNLNGNWNANFDQTVHMPPGYKYNCSLLNTLTNSTGNCTLDLAANQTFITNLGNYIYNTTLYNAFTIGWDQQGATFTSDYTKYGFIPFAKAIAAAARQPYNIEMADKGNLYQQLNIRSNYTAAQFVQDCNTVNSAIYGVVMNGPGTTDSADSSWYAINSNVYNYCGYFTLRGVIFPNVSDLTINNLLSENYTAQFLRRRMTANGASFLNDFSNYLGGFSDIRLVDDPMGVPGLTNSFAACIWALEMGMQFFFQSGFRIDFFSSFQAGSAQGLFGPAPTYAPTLLYHTLLLLDIVLLNNPYIDQTLVTSGTSGSIKAYGLDYYKTYGVLLLNKDTNSSRSGEVGVKLSDKNGLYCIYLTASSLTATSGATLAGIQFIANQSAYVGNFTEYSYVKDGSGYYQVPLNYSQVAYCYTKLVTSYNPFPVRRANWEENIHILTVLLLTLALVLAL